MKPAYRSPPLLPTLKALAISVIVINASGASAEESVEVSPGFPQAIDRHGVCRIVQNDGANSIMVPLSQKQEWAAGKNSFLNNLSMMDAVSVESCVPKGGNVWSKITCMEDVSGGSAGYGAWNCPFPKSGTPGFTYSEEDGSCSPAGGGTIVRGVGANPPLYFYEGVLCKGTTVNRQDHFHLGDVTATGWGVFMRAPSFKISGLDSTGTLEYMPRGPTTRIRKNGGPWMSVDMGSNNNRFNVKNGDLIEFEVKGPGDPGHGSYRPGWVYIKGHGSSERVGRIFRVHRPD